MGDDLLSEMRQSRYAVSIKENITGTDTQQCLA